MSLAFDEFGRPFIIIRVGHRALCRVSAAVCAAWPSDRLLIGAQRLCSAFQSPRRPCLQEQETKSRVKGIEAVKSNIQAAKAVSRILRTSLGPKGMDKLLQGPDGDIVISEWARLPAQRPPSATCRRPADRLPPAAGCSQRWSHHPGADGGGEPDRQAAGGAEQISRPRDR